MTMRSHVIDYRIHGDDLQFVEVKLDPRRDGYRRGRSDDVPRIRHRLRVEDGGRHRA